MPFEGQQIYGAKHPPSVKLIKELSTNSPNSNSSLVPGTASPSLGVFTSNLKNTFKNFEQQTSEAWEFDDDDNDNDISKFDFSMPISILDSDAVARKVIKSHQEAQDKLVSAQTSPTVNTKPPSNGPGKALRQGNNSISNIYTTNKQFQTIHTTKVDTGDSNAQKSQYEKFSSLDSVNSSSSLNSKNTKTSPSHLVTTGSDQKRADNESAASSRVIVSHFKSLDVNDSLAKNKTSKVVLASRDAVEDESKLEKFKNILCQNPVNLEELQKASWKGIPRIYRSICWKLLSDYLPLKSELRQKSLEQKRQSYWESVSEYYSSTYIDSHHEMLRQILNDIPRMNPLIAIFQKQVVQEIFQRVLYVWAVRHPGSGYVQGINDLLTPFFTVFLTEYTDKNIDDLQNTEIESLPIESLKQLEADSYWCMSKLLDRIQENYVFCQPGIQNKVKALENLIKRIDIDLYNHLKRNNIDFIQFAFRWMNNLLMREIPLHCTIRLWDTYHAEPFGFSDFHLYVCAAFLVRYSKDLLKEKDFQGLMLLLQNLPTKNMKANDVTLLTAEAYKLQVMFANSPNHTAAMN